MAILKEKRVFKPIKLITPNGLGGHNIYPSSKSGFSINEKMDIWDWFVEHSGAQSILWDKEEKCLVTMSVKENK
jgi:hypothetical protein